MRTLQAGDGPGHPKGIKEGLLEQLGQRLAGGGLGYVLQNETVEIGIIFKSGARLPGSRVGHVLPDRQALPLTLTPVIPDGSPQSAGLTIDPTQRRGPGWLPGFDLFLAEF